MLSHCPNGGHIRKKSIISKEAPKQGTGRGKGKGKGRGKAKLTQKKVVVKAAKLWEEAPVYAEDLPYVPQYAPDPLEDMRQQRSHQARMRAEAIASPYAAMFAAQRSRLM